MMKLQATKKQMRGYNRIISIGYCDAESLLQYQNPFAYSAGINGWACDYYEVNGVLISTGYSPLSSKNTVENNYKLIREYNDKARQIVYGNADYEVKKEQVNSLLSEMVAELSK